MTWHEVLGQPVVNTTLGALLALGGGTYGGWLQSRRTRRASFDEEVRRLVVQVVQQTDGVRRSVESIVVTSRAGNHAHRDEDFTLRRVAVERATEAVTALEILAPRLGDDARALLGRVNDAPDITLLQPYRTEVAGLRSALLSSTRKMTKIPNT